MKGTPVYHSNEKYINRFIVVCALIPLSIWFIYRYHKNSEEYEKGKAILLDIYQDVAFGADWETVVARVNAELPIDYIGVGANFGNPGCTVHVYADVAFVSYWNLEVFFKDGFVDEVKITEDSEGFIPEDAPPPKKSNNINT